VTKLFCWHDADKFLPRYTEAKIVR